MAASASDEQVHKVPLTVLVDKERNRVLFAEAGKNFVDVLFSFLTLPLGTIARLIAKESNMQPVRFGSLSSLYQSVADLDEQHLSTPTCKEMLLHPRNSMEAYCQPLKLNIDDTQPIQYFICEDRDCYRKGMGESCLSTFRNQKCDCGKLLNKVMSPEKLTTENGFVKETAKFIISDDLKVMPNVFGANVVDLLKLSLFSKTPLTDLILKKKQFIDHFNDSMLVFGEEPPDEGRQMVVRAQSLKDKLAKLQCAPQFELSNQLLPIGATPLRRYHCHSKRVGSKFICTLITCPKFSNDLNNINKIRNVGLKFVDPKFPIGESSSPGGFARGPSMYMVTDDLVVTPLSFISVISYLNRSGVPLVDLEERVISIGLKECLSILKASLTSKSALTNALNQFTRTIKEEK
ncbi:hypothetical protein SESBI_03650 [Sesbania bispinosa]|nr:hypothetical protein SESBI_03650 [Sesbania bispinosa]